MILISSKFYPLQRDCRLSGVWGLLIFRVLEKHEAFGLKVQEV